jgi:hypothetical protein
MKYYDDENCSGDPAKERGRRQSCVKARHGQYAKFFCEDE